MPLLERPHNPIDLGSYSRQVPDHHSSFFNFHRVSNTEQAKKMGRQADAIVHAVCLWLDLRLPNPNTQIVIFSPEEPDGRRWLRNNGFGKDKAGGMARTDGTIIVVGNASDPRFWTVLRHEAAHHALRQARGSEHILPFWLDEGIACFFEMGLDSENRPLPNPERRDLLRYLARRRASLHLTSLLRTPAPKMPTGEHYARAWGVVAFLYHQNRSLQTFLQTQPSDPKRSLAHFQATLLHPDQELKDFEKALVHWLEG